MRRFALPPLLCLALIVGCGGGSGTTATTPTGAQRTLTAPGTPRTTAGTTTTTSPAPSAVSKKVATTHVALGSPSDVPRTKGGDNSIQDFGSEAGSAERAAAARVLAAYLGAYAGGDTETACSLLAAGTAQAITQMFAHAPAQGGKAAPKTCAEVMKALMGNVAPQAKSQIGVARVLSLRVDGDRAFVIYDAADKKAYAMPMGKEAGGWKVAALAGTPLL